MQTIITPATTFDLTTLAAVKAELGITGSDDDAILADLIRQASGAIATFCGRAFASEQVRETFRLSAPAPSITLTRWPVTAVHAVTVGGTELAAGIYEADPDTGILARLDGFGLTVLWSAGSIAVEYTGGYILPGENGRTLPHDIERACITLVKAHFAARSRDPMVRSESVPGVLDRSFWVGGFDGAAVPPDVAGLLNPYRQRRPGGLG